MDQQLMQINKEEKKKKVQWDEITIEDIDRLMLGVEKFYEERPSKMNLVWLANTILKRLRTDKDYWVNCEGIKGSGKSNLILLLALLIHRYSGLWQNKVTGKVVRVLPRTTPLSPEWEHIKLGFEFNKNMSFLDSHQDVKNKYNSLDKYGAMIIDEGSKNLHKYNWQSKTQFMLVQMSDTERYQNKCCFVCFPNFKELNPTFRNDRIMARLYVYYRSNAKRYSSCILSVKDENRHIIDPWHTDTNAKMYEDSLKKIPFGARSPEHILRAERRLKGFAGSFDIPSIKHLSPKLWRIYMTYKIENAQKELTDVDEKEIEWEKKMYRWKYAANSLITFIKEKLPYVTLKELGIISSLSSSQISGLKSEMTKNTIES
jgi:energy-coupling factor transporter ATP-binding protein EcfA2